MKDVEASRRRAGLKYALAQVNASAAPRWRKAWSAVIMECCTVRHRVLVRPTCPAAGCSRNARPFRKMVESPETAGMCANSECSASAHGHCDPDAIGELTCGYGCLSDADCGADQLWQCGPDFGTCAATRCRTDAECGDGICAAYAACGSSAFACQTGEDACSVDSDCPSNYLCIVQDFTASPQAAPTAGWPIVGRVCVSAGLCAVIGRPFLVAGSPRLAESVARHDWYGNSAPRGALPVAAPALRRAIVAGWTEQALMEHASVAAFARFSLQLLQVGAPSELVSGAAAAMADEVRHAQTCFELARRHAGVDIGPGPLSSQGAFETMALTDIVLCPSRKAASARPSPPSRPPRRSSSAKMQPPARHSKSSAPTRVATPRWPGSSSPGLCKRARAASGVGFERPSMRCSPRRPPRAQPNRSREIESSPATAC
jgi:hypothetical protein